MLYQLSYHRVTRETARNPERGQACSGGRRAATHPDSRCMSGRARSLSELPSGLMFNRLLAANVAFRQMIQFIVDSTRNDVQNNVFVMGVLKPTSVHCEPQPIPERLG